MYSSRPLRRKPVRKFFCPATLSGSGPASLRSGEPLGSGRYPIPRSPSRGDG
nr:MAG TPA: hypothetical protein [Caudoviricetes sp.]